MDSLRPALRELDDRGPDAIGRRARLELAFERHGSRTILAHSYAEPPFRVGGPFDLDGAAHVIVASAGPGIFGGDSLRQIVHVGPGACAVLTSQAALQARPAGAPQACDVATLRAEYAVGRDAELHCEWDPVIPFGGARLDQRFDIRIAADSRLFWSDAVMAGRVSRGEAWRFASLAHELALRVDLALEFLERYTLDRPGERTNRPWSDGGAAYFGTLLVYHCDASTEVAERWTRELAERRNGELAERRNGELAERCAEVRAAADLVSPRLIAARAMSADGPAFARFRAAYRAAALADIFRRPELAARK